MGVGCIRRNIEETSIQVHLQSSATSMEEQNCQIVRDLEEEKQLSFYINELREETDFFHKRTRTREDHRRSQKKHHLQDMSLESP